VAEFTVSVKVDDGKLRMMAERHLEDRLADGVDLDPVEQIESELLEGWADEVAQYGADIWPDMMVASAKVEAAKLPAVGDHPGYDGDK
jgi:hypothetical protein